MNSAGCDAILIAMGSEAGRHRGLFLSDDLNTQIGLLRPLTPDRRHREGASLIAQPVVLAMHRVLSRRFALGASTVKSAQRIYFTPEATVSASHHRALRHAQASELR